jgi:hypothetical protein
MKEACGEAGVFLEPFEMEHVRFDNDTYVARAESRGANAIHKRCRQLGAK